MNNSDKNLTGISTSPDMAAEMLEAANEVPPTSMGTQFGDEVIRFDVARGVEPKHRSYGTVPPPEPELLTNMLGARLAFERTGVRLYEILISKVDALGSFEGGPDREQLQSILNEEHCHFSLLHQTILDVGGDPTAVTPAADLTGVLGGGILQVTSDARTTVLECLQAILVAELADNAGWEELTAIARELGNDELAESFTEAEKTEQNHLTLVKGWIAAGQGRQS